LLLLAAAAQVGVTVLLAVTIMAERVVAVADCAIAITSRLSPEPPTWWLLVRQGLLTPAPTRLGAAAAILLLIQQPWLLAVVVAAAGVLLAAAPEELGLVRVPPVLLEVVAEIMLPLRLRHLGAVARQVILVTEAQAATKLILAEQMVLEVVAQVVTAAAAALWLVEVVLAYLEKEPVGLPVVQAVPVVQTVLLPRREVHRARTAGLMAVVGQERSIQTVNQVRVLARAARCALFGPEPHVRSHQPA